MKKDIIRLVFGCSLSMVVGMAVAQDHGSRGSSSGSSSHSSGGGGGTTSRSTGGETRSSSGGYSRGTSGSGYSGSYSGSYSRGASSSGYSRSGSSDGYSHSTSRYQSGERGSSDFGARSESTSSSRYSSGSSTSRYSNSYRSSESSSYRGFSNRESSVDNSFARGHADLSRSGVNSYSGNNNLNGAAGSHVEATRFNTAPRGPLGPSTLGHVIGDNHVGLVRGGYRVGYFGYYGGWRDSFFAFPFYVFDPFFAACYVSPWYYYPCLPGYVAAPNVVIVNSYPSAGWSGSSYDWEPSTRNSSNPVLDSSIQDIIDSFESDDHKAIDRVTPHSGNVNIYVDGKYSYSLKANDFYDTYVDGIESTKTDRYEILDVQAKPDGTARVVAKHVYNDPWGNRTYVYHSYFLAKEGNEYVIREFGTSDYRTGW